MKKIPRKLLGTAYRKETWIEANKLIKKIEKIIPISSLYLMGSFSTKKKRPADVDFMLLLKSKNNLNKKWSIDFVIAPDNEHGKTIVEDAHKWMKQKYGTKNFDFLRLK